MERFYFILFSNMDIENPPLVSFVGDFSWLCPMTTHYWLFTTLVMGTLILSRMNCTTKKVICDALITIGVSFFILYLLTAYLAYRYSLISVNALGGLLETQKMAYYQIFVVFFTLRTGVIISYILIVLFERFSLLPYIDTKYCSALGNSTPQKHIEK